MPFYVFLVILVTMTFLTTSFIPEHINHNNCESDTAVEVSYFTILKNRRILFA